MMAKEIGTLILMVIVALILVPVVISLAAYVGYYYGIIISIVAGSVLTAELLNVPTDMIPTIVAWLFVFSAIISLGRGNGVDK